MKLILMSMLTVGLQQWLPLTTLGGCPQGGDVEKKVVVVTDGKVHLVGAGCCEDAADCCKGVVGCCEGTADCYVSASLGGTQRFALLTAGEDAINDGRSEPRVVKLVSERKGDAAERGWLGVSISEVPEALASQLETEDRGVMILNVVAESPADRAGLEAHDIILSVDGDAVEGKTGRAVDLIKSRRPDETVTITVLRGSREKTIAVTLGSRAGMKEPKFRWKFKGEPAAEIKERTRTRAKMMRKDDEGKWVIKNLGDLKMLKELPKRIQMFVPKSGDRSTQIFIDGGDKKVKTTVERDGATIVITREADGPITVARVDKNGHESEIEYDDEDELREADEEAYELWTKAAGNAVIHMDIDGINIPHIEIPDFEFDFDAEEFGEDMEEWGKEFGRHMEHWGEEFGEEMQEWGEHFGELMQRHAEGEELPDDVKLPPLPKFLGKDGRPGLPGLMHLRSLAKPKHTFEARTDGTIEVRIRKGGSELVQIFRDEDDLARRKPELFEKYEELMSLEE